MKLQSIIVLLGLTLPTVTPAQIVLTNTLTIPDWAYMNRSDLTNVIIPDGITRIGIWAFYSCRNLTTIAIPNSVTNIGLGAFADDRNLSNAVIPNSVTTIGETAFGDTGLNTLTIPDSVTSIGISLCGDCLALTNVTIGNGVTSIGEGAFMTCRALTDLTIGNRVTNIGDRAFYTDASLRNLVIPDSVTSIGKEAFYACSNLTRIIVGKGVTTIGSGTFACTAGVNYGWPTTAPFSVCFKGDAPTNVAPDAFCSTFAFSGTEAVIPCNATVYALPGTKGWMDPTNSGATLPQTPLAWPWPPGAGRPVWYAEIKDPFVSDHQMNLPVWGNTNMVSLPFVLEASDDLQTWQPLSINTMQPAWPRVYGPCLLSLSDPATNSARFYRVRAADIDWP